MTLQNTGLRKISASGGAIAVLALICIASAKAQREPSSPIVTAEDDRGAARSLTVTLSATKAEFQQLEPIVVEYEARNTDPQGQSLKISQYYYTNRRVKAFGTDSEPVPETNYARMKMHLPAGGSNGFSGHFPPSAVAQGRLAANLVNDMTAPGWYTIVVEVDFWYHDAGNWHREVAHSNPVKVEVVPGPFTPNR